VRLKATAKDLIHRNTPKLYARYMRANPLYFEGLFHVRFTERNLERALETMFSGRSAGRGPWRDGRRAGIRKR